MRPDHQRIAITGIGIHTVLGQDPAQYYKNLIAGKSGLSRWRNIEPRCISQIGGDLSNFELKRYLLERADTYPNDLLKQAQRLLRNSPFSCQVSICTALQAYVDSGFDAETDPYRFGHVLAGHNINARFIYDEILNYQDEPEYIESLYGLVALDTDLLGASNQLLGLKGPSFLVGGACASSNLAILNGLDLIRSGRADRVLITGAVCDVDPATLQGWGIMEALSFKSFNDHPEQASRPFDRRREGFVPSHGAGAIVLERYDLAKQRNAHIYAELMGASCGSDACRSSKPNIEGQVTAIQGCLADAQLNPEKIDYINAHATSTQLGDLIEVQSIKQVFGSHAYNIPINATKSMIGHCLLSASMVECIATLLQMQHNVAHPTINLEASEPELDLNFVSNSAQDHNIQYALSNSFGFGGINSSIVLGKV